MAYSGGSGISTDPYQIASLSDINQLKADVVAGLTNDVYYKQTADITLGTFEPIGYKSTTPFYYSFNGFYDGNYKVLKDGTISYPGKDYIGIFAFAGQSNYLDDGLLNIIVNNVSVSGRNYIGVISGRINGELRQCTTDSSCVVTGTANYIGGIAGSIANGSFTNCKNSASVTGVDYVGGIVGHVSNGKSGGCILNCHNLADITGRNRVGGLVGFLEGNTNYYAYVYNTINSGNISGVSYVGGIAGYSSYTSLYCAVKNSYALNDSITRLSGTATTFGRIVGYGTDLNNNYALDTMEFISIP